MGNRPFQARILPKFSRSKNSICFQSPSRREIPTHSKRRTRTRTRHTSRTPLASVREFSTRTLHEPYLRILSMQLIYLLPIDKRLDPVNLWTLWFKINDFVFHWSSFRGSKTFVFSSSFGSSWGSGQAKTIASQWLGTLQSDFTVWTSPCELHFDVTRGSPYSQQYLVLPSMFATEPSTSWEFQVMIIEQFALERMVYSLPTVCIIKERIGKLERFFMKSFKPLAWIPGFMVKDVECFNSNRKA